MFALGMSEGSSKGSIDRGDGGIHKDSSYDMRIQNSSRSTFNSIPSEIVEANITPRLQVGGLLNLSEVNSELEALTKETRQKTKEASRLHKLKQIVMKREATNNHVEILLNIDPIAKSITLHCFATIAVGGNFFLPNFYEKFEELKQNLEGTFNTDLVIHFDTSFKTITKTESIALSPDVHVLDENSLKGYGNAIYTFMEQMMIEGYHTFYVVSEGGYLHFKIATETTLDELQKEEARYYPPTIYTEYEFDKNTITNEISTLLQLDR